MNELDNIFEPDFDETELSNIIVLNDKNGEAVEFEFIDLIEYENKEYIVLLPIEDEDGEVVILKVEDGENEDEEAYVSVDDKNILMAVFGIFKEKLQGYF